MHIVGAAGNVVCFADVPSAFGQPSGVGGTNVVLVAATVDVAASGVDEADVEAIVLSEPPTRRTSTNTRAINTGMPMPICRARRFVLRLRASRAIS